MKTITYYEVYRDIGCGGWTDGYHEQIIGRFFDKELAETFAIGKCAWSKHRDAEVREITITISESIEEGETVLKEMYK